MIFTLYTKEKLRTVKSLDDGIGVRRLKICVIATNVNNKKRSVWLQGDCSRTPSRAPHIFCSDTAERCALK